MTELISFSPLLVCDGYGQMEGQDQCWFIVSFLLVGDGRGDGRGERIISSSSLLACSAKIVLESLSSLYERVKVRYRQCQSVRYATSNRFIIFHI